MKSMIVAAAAAFMLTGTASAGVPAKLVIAKDVTGTEPTAVASKPGSGRGSGVPPITICTPFGCQVMKLGGGS